VNFYTNAKVKPWLQPILLLLSVIISYLIYDNQDLISDDNLHALIMAICACVAVFVGLGSWNYLTDGKELMLSKNIRIKNFNITYSVLSFLFAWTVFKNYSPYMFDDSAFTLRYLDNFWDGYFYNYNKSDPPVFGISCFTFGVFTGFWCWLHLLSPEQSVYLAGFSGLVMVSFLTFKILFETCKDKHLTLIFWLVIVFSSKMFLNVAKSGMESAFHISILFAALLFFLQNKSRWMWLFLALSIISKLDAVPFVFVIGLTYLVMNRKQILPLSWKNNFVKEFCLYAVLPIFVWVLFATLVFGSPLPQSAYSKIFLHAHPSDYWFPFIKYYFFGGRVVLVFRLFLAFFVLHTILVCFKSKDFSFKNLVFGFSFFATMVLFYFYNPGEQMTWYYVLPDLLLLLQIAVSFAFFTSLIPLKIVRTLLTIVALFFFVGWTGVDVIGGKYWMETYLESVERERLEVGKYVGTMVGENDSIMSNHGLPVRFVKGYVIDMSGLNSKYAASLNVDPEQLFKINKPEWAISHNSSGYALFLSANGFEPTRIFYDITNYAFPQWCLYKRLPDKNESFRFKPLDSLAFLNTKPSYNGGIVYYVKDTIRFKLDSASLALKLFMGVKRVNEPITLEINRFKDSQLLSTELIEIPPVWDYEMDSKFTKGISVDTKQCNSIEITSKKPGHFITLIEPYIYKKFIPNVFQ
jgi:hypothetical protein